MKQLVSVTQNGIKIYMDQAVFELLINNSKTAWATEILMPFLSFSDNLL